MPGYPDNVSYGLLLPTTIVYDIERQGTINVNNREFKDFMVQLRNSVNAINLTMNKKVNGNCNLGEKLSGRYFFQRIGTSAQTTTERPEFARVLYLQTPGGLPLGATNIAHSIDATIGQLTFTQIQAVANDTVALNYYPLPYFNGPADYISIRVDGTNVIITSSAARANIREIYVVLGYLKY
jgi:hypothetical protein